MEQEFNSRFLYEDVEFCTQKLVQGIEATKYHYSTKKYKLFLTY